MNKGWKRSDLNTYPLDVERLRSGYYTDKYFENVARILGKLAAEGYTYGGKFSLPGLPADATETVVGDSVVEMQIFTKRKPFSIVAGIDAALAMFKKCAGYFDETGTFVTTSDKLEIEALYDGMKVEPWMPALKVRGRYRDFAILETPALGVIARATRIATNTYLALEASGGRPLLFFPARFDIYETQMIDGYAYKVGVDAYNREYHTKLDPFISTDAQGQLFGGTGGGTIPHAYILAFFSDTAEATVQFARMMPAEVKRVALVDTNNDCVTDSVRTAEAMFTEYIRLKNEGDTETARKYVLYGVRLDTARNMIDRSIHGEVSETIMGVCPQLVRNVRWALNAHPAKMNLSAVEREEAKQYFRDVKIIVSSGFTPEKIREFERNNVPADVYALGTYLLHGGNNDFTADVVRVKIAGAWYEMAKEGRRPLNNNDLSRVMW